MDKLQICVMGMPNTSAPSFKNLPDTLSIPAALLTLHDFKRLEIVFYLVELFGDLVYFDSIQTCHSMIGIKNKNLE